MTSQLDAAQLLDELNKLPRSDLAAENGEVRRRALGLGRALTAKLEDPLDRATELIFAPFTAPAVRMAVDLRLFELISEQGGVPISSVDLAAAAGGEVLLVTRLCRLLASIGLVAEPAADEWAARAETRSMALPAVAAGHRFVYDVTLTAGMRGPKFVREAGFRSPSEPADGFVQYAFQTRYNVFELVGREMPERLRDFNAFMGNTMGNKIDWFDHYPVQQRLLDGYDPATALLVDVGGGKGHDLLAFYRRFPDCSGGSSSGNGNGSGGSGGAVGDNNNNSGDDGAGANNNGKARCLVLQDLAQAQVVAGGGDAGLLGDAPIEIQQHDFFDEQPVRGARAYYLHHILHDWHDKHALAILRRLRDAMAPGYSRLLVHDLVLPDIGASKFQCVYDIAMMSFNSALERSRRQWAALLAQAGLEVVDFWVVDDQTDGLVEAVVKA